MKYRIPSADRYREINLRYARSANVSVPEMTLSEMLNDPLVQVVMARDRVGRGDLIGLIANVRTRLAPAPSERIQA